MARTFTAAFTALQTNKGTAPYFILEIQWGGATGTKYYLDRASTDFAATGTRVPASGIGTAKVMNWGAIAIALKEGQLGGVDQLSVVLDDPAGELTTILGLEAKQRKKVIIYRLFDNSTTVWATDAATMFVGSLRPFDWSGSDNTVTLNFVDASSILTKDIACIAKKTIFTSIPVESRDRNIPLAWGTAHRVPALLVSRPWETKIRQSIDGSTSQTVDIDDHPDDMGVASGVAMDAFLGDEPVTVTFNQSAVPDTIPSTVTVNGSSNQVSATAVVVYVFNTGADRYLVIPNTVIYPEEFRDIMDTIILAGDSAMVFLSSSSLTGATSPPFGWNTATISSISRNTPWPLHYKVVLSGSGIMDNILPGAQIKFLMGVTYRPPSMPGTVLRARTGNWIYAMSALPSKQVIKVEGFGDVEDDAGYHRKDFVPIGQLVGDIVQGAGCLDNQLNTTGAFFVINLNDSTWAFSPGGGLGRNISTITFFQSPRHLCPKLDDNNIWITLRGVDDAGSSFGGLVENPAKIIQEYLTNIKLMGISTSDVNSASFMTAAASLTGIKCGFAQLEPVNGLAILQAIANQCHSVLFFDQGQVYITVLSNTPGTSIKTFDTTGNDNVLMGSLGYIETAIEDVVNELTAKWRKYWDAKSGATPLDVKAINTASQTAFGRLAREMAIDIYWKRTDVETEVAFWLARWSAIWRRVHFTSFHDALHLQPNDEVTLSYVDGEARTLISAQKMWLTRAIDTGLQGLVELEAQFQKFTY